MLRSKNCAAWCVRTPRATPPYSAVVPHGALAGAYIYGKWKNYRFLLRTSLCARYGGSLRWLTSFLYWSRCLRDEPRCAAKLSTFKCTAEWTAWPEKLHRRWPRPQGAVSGALLVSFDSPGCGDWGGGGGRGRGLRLEGRGHREWRRVHGLRVHLPWPQAHLRPRLPWRRLGQLAGTHEAGTPPTQPAALPPGRAAGRRPSPRKSPAPCRSVCR